MSADFSDQRGECPYCGNHVAASQSGWAEVYPEWQTDQMVLSRLHSSYTSTPAMPQAKDKITVLRCQYCDESIVFLDHLERQDSGTDGHPTMERTARRMIVPEQSPRELPPATPESIRELYAEASACENVGAFRGAGVLYRAVTEEIVKDQGADPKLKLYPQIQSFKGVLSDDVVQALDESRLVGNWSIHENLAFSGEEIADVADLLHDACRELYELPAQREAMRHARQARREAHRGTPSS
ncbi:DUF4145 domain-containing protein [Micrococcus porci]|uniref:DUF4145 domain-containing protein n=1 Tax=Micrococcus porci TaxID=2856555 RepID=UPI003CFA4EB6